MRMTRCFTRAVVAATLMLALAQTMMPAKAAETLGSWQKRMPITFAGYTPGRETLTNFPVLVILSNTTYGSMIADAVTGMDLTVGGGAGAATVTGNAPLTVIAS